MKFKARIKKRSGFDITPMIDIVFLLIIFFMVSSELVKTRGMSVKLPESTSSDADTKNLIIIAITAEGKIFLNEEEVSIQKLGSELRRLKVEMMQDTVVIRGDNQIPYRNMVEVMDTAKLAGIAKISLATSQKPAGQ